MFPVVTGILYSMVNELNNVWLSGGGTVPSLIFAAAVTTVSTVWELPNSASIS